MQAGNIPTLTISRPMTNSSNLLPPFGVVVDSITSQQHYPTQIQDSSTQALQQQPSSSYNVYGGVDYSSQAPTPSATQSQNVHLQQQLPQSQTHPYSGFNHPQAQQNNSSNVQRVKYYYPAYIGKSGIVEVEESLRPTPPEEVLTTGFRISIKRCDMATLVGSNWLNDEVINFYMNLIVQRGKTEGFNSVYIPSTFFFPMVMKRGYSGVRRWTKNVDIFDHDLMLIPIHLEMENHWTLIAVDFLQSSICYYDSYLQDKDEAMDAILEYLKEEMKSKKNIDMDVNCWVKVNMKNIPLQENLSDCGVFSCIYAEYISRGAQMDFTQEDMPYFRRKMVYEILHHKITVNSPRDTENLISDDLIQDMVSAANGVPNLLEPPVSLENGLPDGSLSPNDNSMKVNEENAGLTGNAKERNDDDDDDDEISKDSAAQPSSSDVDGELKMSGDDEHKKKYPSQIVAEMKRIANAFEEANAKEQEVLLNRLRHLQKSYSQILKQKNKHKKHKVGHRSLKDLISLGKVDSETSVSLSDVSLTTSTTSSSSSSSSSSASGSSEEETKSSDDANMSSNPDSQDHLKLSHITWEVEKLLMSFTDVVRSIGKASNRFSVNKRLLDPNGSFSVIKGMDYISSELQCISNHYTQMLMEESPKKTAVKKRVSRSATDAVKLQQKRVVRCITPRLMVRRTKSKRKPMKRLRTTQKASDTTKANVIPKKVASTYGEFYQAESIDRELLSSLVKDAGGRLLNSPPYTRKVKIQESLLTKFPLPDGIFDLTSSPFENTRKKQARRCRLRRSYVGKKGKKKK